MEFQDINIVNSKVKSNKFVHDLTNILAKNYKKTITFLCIGTSSVIGDSIGPLVGSKLKNQLENYANIKIIGDNFNNITYKKILGDFDLNKHSSEFVIVIDSALSNKNNIGKIFVQNNGLRYAEALNKPNKIIGNACIKAVVGLQTSSSFINYINLKKADINQINTMSENIVNGIYEAIFNITML